VQAPFALTDNQNKYDVMVNVRGGGISGQAEAIRLGISKALVDIDAEFKSVLRQAGFMTRDSRVVERKKPGQKKARKRFQFSKR
jgi:small subunit ribosomal protein S9